MLVQGLEGWGYVKLNAPVERQEVSQALEDLAVMGGIPRRCDSTPHTSAPARPFARLPAR